jgi:hypothetical protein
MIVDHAAINTLPFFREANPPEGLGALPKPNSMPALFLIRFRAEETAIRTWLVWDAQVEDVAVADGTLAAGLSKKMATALPKNSTGWITSFDDLSYEVETVATVPHPEAPLQPSHAQL